MDAVSRSIFVLGAPRSGTTWLAKILDSHPDVLYRHEPDEFVQPAPEMDPVTLLGTWVRTRTLRTAAKRPFFPKSFLSGPRLAFRIALASTLSGASRLPVAGKRLERVPLPDMVGINTAPNLRIVLKLVNWDATPIARALPHSRHLFILRHPCGQIASIIKGARQGRFGDMEAIGLSAADAASAAAHAARHGEKADFASLPRAARLAWGWRAFNEKALERLGQQRNVKIVMYEELCENPVPIAKSLVAFAGLKWHPQVEGFLDQSTSHTGKSGYFDVLRSSVTAASQWRRSMSAEDQDAVCSVVSASPLARYWPEFAAAA